MPGLLNIDTIADVKMLTDENFRLGGKSDMTEAEFRHLFAICGGLWIHNGDYKMPHAELTSGNCSDGFVDALKALSYTNICDIIALLSVRKLRQEWPCLKVDWVVSSDHAGAAFGHSVSRLLNARFDFTEKGPPGSEKQEWKRFTIQPGEVVLQVEELVTTTKTLTKVREGIQEGNKQPVTYAPVVFTLIHRSDVYKFGEGPIAFYKHLDINIWHPNECPLCKNGSKRLRPKAPQENWLRLTGQIS